jgi:hypothetical protein
MWATLAGISGLAALAFGPGLFPSWYFLLTAAGYGLILPVLAVLHVRHQSMRESGAVLGTAAGTATVIVGIVASGNDALIVATLFVRAIWWWTIGKLWWETSLLPSWLAVPTMALAVISFGAAIVTAPMGIETQSIWMTERAVLGSWLLALAYALWRIR